ncbi:hypothetical protein BAZOLSSOX_1326 [uncultured Gammaproteobacteria bacterium]|nr:hypothetical protein BAZOLSSOX_1326 [uncultured Gammaproteobacteria bacterium]
MVVNKLGVRLLIVLTFLSHLCGGEFNLISFNKLLSFLSHLCGGE